MDSNLDLLRKGLVLPTKLVWTGGCYIETHLAEQYGYDYDADGGELFVGAAVYRDFEVFEVTDLDRPHIKSKTGRYYTLVPKRVEPVQLAFPFGDV